MRIRLLAPLFLALSLGTAGAGFNDVPPLSHGEIAARLIAAYPSFVKGIDGKDVIFTDGTKLPLDDGQSVKSFDAWLDDPDIEDMFRQVYPAGTPAIAPPKNFDPGRARNETFFTKIYGDCRKGAVQKNLVDVVWLPGKVGQRIKITTINGVAEQLKSVSAELDRLPKRFVAYLYPIAGTFSCRDIAGTKSVSAHSYGIAIDISLRHAHYWRWAKGGPDGPIVYRNAIPLEVVAAFEKHGFIWGGRWHHYDTMHFEYRPELLNLARPTK